MKSGLNPVRPDTRDYSLLHTFGGLTTEPAGLPDNFSLYAGQAIPNQNQPDSRFPFSVPSLPEGCTGESGAFETGMQDGVLYNPQDLYLATPPGDPYSGRDLRAMLGTLISRGVKDANGNLSPKRTAYFNCYGAGAIDDFDAARIALWINQWEKRGVYLGTYWYWGDAPSTTLTVPSFNTSGATMHCYIATGWMTWGGTQYLEIIPWIGMDIGEKGRFWLSRDIYNKLMDQPYTGAMTVTKTLGTTPIPIGLTALADHAVYALNQFIRNLFSA